MPVARLLAASLALCSTLLFAQDKPENMRLPGNFVISPDSRSTPIASEPWRILPSPLQDSYGRRALIARAERYEPDGYEIDTSGMIVPPHRFYVEPLADSTDDKLCFTIRSYVVERDEKDSDSTHPVGSSTCQPARRYALKKVQISPDSSGH